MTRRTESKNSKPGANAPSSRWLRLKTLRSAFIDSRESLTKDYWQDQALLELYDESLGRRIAWKWQAVMDELKLRDLLTPLLENVDTLVDWGCGTGVASEMFLGNAMETHQKRCKNLVLLDRSALATGFAHKKLSALGLSENCLESQKFNSEGPRTGLLISHVINEMPAPEVSKIIKAAQMSRFVLWVEPGAREQSRKLSEVRDALYSHGFHAWAPCLHQKKCPVLADGHENDWCHSFAESPQEIHHSSFWSEFSQMMGIDLRSNPYSFVLLSKDLPPPSPLKARVLQRPRILKAHAEVEVCRVDGTLAVEKVEKRSQPDLYKTLKKELPFWL